MIARRIAAFPRRGSVVAEAACYQYGGDVMQQLILLSASVLIPAMQSPTMICAEADAIPVTPFPDPAI